MQAPRETDIDRLGHHVASLDDTYYLHLRTLFRDLEKVSTYARGRLLDIGCGNKPYASMFAGRVDTHVGCDVVQSSKHCVDIICPATQLPMADASYETVLATQVIEHVADHRKMIEEAFRVLTPGGVLILSGPLYWPLHEEPYDFFRFTEHGLRYLLEGAGFAIEELLSNGGQWALCGQVLIHSVRQTRLERRWLIRLINRVFARLDDRKFQRINPMNYVVVARKP